MLRVIGLKQLGADHPDTLTSQNNLERARTKGNFS